jgi:hypothetical protein
LTNMTVVIMTVVRNKESIMSAVATAHVVRSVALHRDAWDPALTLEQARAEYFRFNGFGEDGGYGAKWVEFKLGPIPFPFPNTKQRVDAVRFHDLHHVMTGYQTDLPGEFEISGWELGSGCADKSAAWVLNLGGFFAGMVIAPRRTLRAFVRGRHSRNLYRHRFDDALLSRTVGDVRRELGLEGAPRATAADLQLAAVAWVAGLVIGSLTFALLLPLAPFGYLAGRVFRK